MRARILEILERAPSAPSGYAEGFTHRELACAVYVTAEPTAAQQSAVRRAVAALVAAGRAVRETEDRRAYASIGDVSPSFAAATRRSQRAPRLAP